jgi:(p)ppGpp synthase/HD superfamily hydrolase
MIMKRFSPINVRVLSALNRASLLHEGQKYGNMSYFHGHILPCFNVAIQLTNDPNWLIAVIFHDAFEDTQWKDASPQELQSIRDAYGPIGIDGALTCTDGPGKNRKERKAFTYEALQHSVVGRFAKLVDRYCNVAASDQEKIAMYIKEHPDFKAALFNADDMLMYPHIFNKLWNAIEERMELE